MRKVMLLGDIGWHGLGDQFPADIYPEDPDKPQPLPDIPPLPAPKGSGWPPAAKPSKQAWRKDGTYVLQPGDTLSGLAKTYLGQYTRWKEIWAVQTPEFLAKHKTADKVYAGEIMQMPPEAQDAARGLGFLPKRWIPWAIGGAAVAVVGGGAAIYAAR